jgi:hypothetical protein
MQSIQAINTKTIAVFNQVCCIRIFRNKIFFLNAVILLYSLLLFCAEEGHIKTFSCGTTLKKIFKSAPCEKVIFIDHSMYGMMAPECALISYVNAGDHKTVQWLLQDELDVYGLSFMTKDCGEDCSDFSHHKTLNPCMIATWYCDVPMIRTLYDKQLYCLFAEISQDNRTHCTIDATFHMMAHEGNNLNYALCATACCNDFAGMIKEYEKGIKNKRVVTKNENSQPLVIWAALKNKNINFLYSLFLLSSFKSVMSEYSVKFLHALLLGDSLPWFCREEIMLPDKKIYFDDPHTIDFFESVLEKNFFNINQQDKDYEPLSSPTILDYCLGYTSIYSYFEKMENLLRHYGAKTSKEIKNRY